MKLRPPQHRRSIVTDHVAAFPHQPAGKPKSTIAEIVMDRAKPNMPAHAMLAGEQVGQP
jgi:hypothetical protein